MSLANVIQELLLTTHHHVASVAVAYTSISRDIFHVYCVPGQLGNDARDTIARTADSFLIECRTRREPLIKNRVREVPGGPLICRLLAVPIRDDAGELTGVMMIHRMAGDEEFDEHEQRLSQLLGILVPLVLGTVRDAKRTMAGFELLHRLLRFEVDEVDLLGWAAIQAKYPDVEQVLRRRQEQIIGPEPIRPVILLDKSTQAVCAGLFLEGLHVVDERGPVLPV